jgi:DNA-binding transcriptional MerR regulator/effector-binding domain-containing protein
MDQYLTAGKFAALCRVKKDTIFYYDQIGLLCPDYIGENGYRYYSPQQAMIFEIISILKNAGMSLHEIKTYSAQQNTEEFLHLLDEKHKHLQEMQQQISDMQDFVGTTMNMIRKVMHIQPGCVFEEQCADEYLIITSPPDTDDMNDESYWSSVQTMAAFSKEKKMGNVFPIGEVVLAKDFVAGNFSPTYYCSKPVEKSSSPHILHKSGGKYAVTYHKGTYKSLHIAYQRLLNYIVDGGLEIRGDVYEQDQIYLFSKEDPYTYLLKVSVEIE